MLEMRQKSVMSTRLNHFWVFRGHFGGSIWDVVELGEIEKLLFSPIGSPEVATGTPGSSNRPGAQF